MASGQKEAQSVVVLAVDGSKQAEFAFEYYAKYIHRPSYLLVLVHVIEIPDISRQVFMSPEGYAEALKQEEEKANCLESKFVEKLKVSGIGRTRFRTEGGMKPGHVITNVAAEEKAVMVIMGTRGLGKLRRTIVGSVSDYVVHHAQCPVVVCRQRD